MGFLEIATPLEFEAFQESLQVKRVTSLVRTAAFPSRIVQTMFLITYYALHAYEGNHCSAPGSYQ